MFIFFKYPPKYSLSYIAKRIKGSTSRILRKEFPHLREWCGEHFWAPSWVGEKRFMFYPKSDPVFVPFYCKIQMLLFS
jgi:hypothetical protein